MNTILFIEIFSGLFALVNPLLGLSVFLSFTVNTKLAERIKLAFFASFTMFIVLAMATCCGPEILKIFGLHVASFQISGGVIVGMIALSMLNGRPGFASDVKVNNEANFAVIPLAFPIMAGPGAISKLITYSVAAVGIYDIIAIYAAVGAIACVTFFVFVSSNIFNKILGKTGVIIVTKILAIILGAMAVDLIICGIKEAFLIH